jgi:hypothetical protein
MKRFFVAALALLGLASCENDAKLASNNLSQAADSFQINRRIIFYNGITGDYMLSIEGLCALEPQDRKVMVTCKTGPGLYKKHYLGLSDNVTYFAEQIGEMGVSTAHYKVIFKPSTIIPDIDLK